MPLFTMRRPGRPGCSHIGLLAQKEFNIISMISATAHYVTDELDEGPIIAQQIIPASHSHGVQDMVKAGKEIETAVLAKALKLVFDDRVFVYRNKTVVLE